MSTKPKGAVTGGAKQQTGKSQHRVVLQLKPVEYRLSLIYLGDRRVRHSPATNSKGYHCSFEMKRGSSAVEPLQKIENVIRGWHSLKEEDKRVVLPLSAGGDNGNPSGGENPVRVLIRDGHGMTTHDSEMNGGNLLGDGADAKSKVDSYTSNEFIHDIVPDVPLRVVVRKFIGNDPVSLKPDELRILWEIKDPPEDLDQTTDPRAKDFVKRFIEAERFDSAKPGGDNAALEFGGLRDPRGTAATAGIPAARALFELPYVATPPVDRVQLPLTPIQPKTPLPKPPMNDLVDHPDPLVPLTAHSNDRALSKLTGVEELFIGQRVTVGVSDVLFRPAAISGDNYRFLLTLTDPSGQDVRELEDEDRSVKTLDDQRVEIPLPRHYATPRFVVWRRVDFRLVVRTNKLPSTHVSWARVTSYYKPAYWEVPDPLKEYELTWTGWVKHIRDFFQHEGIPIAGINDDLNFPDAQFGQFFWPVVCATVPPSWNPPDFGNWMSSETIRRSGNPPSASEQLQFRQSAWYRELDTFHQRITRRIIKAACQTEGIAPPTETARQMNAEGFYALVSMPATPFSGLGGVSMGDQYFIMARADNPTLVLVHELGHAVYLRHCVTTRFAPKPVWLMKAGLGTERVQLFSMKINCSPLDHDHRNAVDCVMSYDNATIQTNLCGGCLLHLRFYEMKRLRAKHLHPLITSGWDPAAIRWVFMKEPMAPDEFSETFLPLPKNMSLTIATLAEPEPTITDATVKSGKVLDTLDNTTYTVDPAGQGVSVSRTFGNSLWSLSVGPTATPGKYTLRFLHSGRERARTELDVT